jgi:hypothetical protein
VRIFARTHSTRRKFEVSGRAFFFRLELGHFKDRPFWPDRVAQHSEFLRFFLVGAPIFGPGWAVQGTSNKASQANNYGDACESHAAGTNVNAGRLCLGAE